MKHFYFAIIVSLFSTLSFSQIINFPDSNFKTRLLIATPENPIARDMEGNAITIDTNADNEIDITEALTVFQLLLNSVAISDLTGIENFSNLEILNIATNDIDNFNASTLFNLKELVCNGNNMVSLDVTGLSQLEILWCYQNNLTELDLIGVSGLQDLVCNGNQITTLDVTGSSLLTHIECSYNPIISLNLGVQLNLIDLDCVGLNINTLDISECPAIETARIFDNQLNTIETGLHLNLVELILQDNNLVDVDLSGMPNVEILNLNNNNLVTADLSQITSLALIYLNNNELVTLFMKNGIVDFISFLGNNSTLQYICADEQEIEELEMEVGVNVNVNSYCSFTPGGEFFTVEGIATYDFNSDGCDPTESAVPYLQFELFNGTESGSFTANDSGNFSLYLEEGMSTITPVLENPDYYTISPTVVTVNFPTDSNPFMQDFCVIPNSVHPDLEINIVPITVARPGFDAEYQIVYSNKGNQLLSGDVSLTYPETLMTYVTAIPNFDAQTTSTFTWNYSDLEPFETRIIDLTFTINAPTETPPVEIDDVLSFITNINPVSADENPSDNEFILNQTVVGSFDPNDITCLQGKSVTPETVGEYVHYLIRFENTGTFPAENIVVRDDIDDQKFDLNSFRTLNGSHPFVTRITGNKVEFIFENVNLPFDDANNDGFVLFKIRTLPTLNLGDTFSNNAEIYFDFNFPIITNIFVTTIETQLGVDDFVSSNDFMIYPNPATTTISLKLKNNIQVHRFEIIDLLGQIIKTEPMISDTEINVSELSAGTYIIKIETDSGINYGRFIKK